jgi:pimeloyl-ACP methyl ester carboxylesterase
VAVIEPPETQYTKTDDGAHIAFQVCGDGPPDLVFERGIGSRVELAWEIAALARVFRRLASFSRLIRFDHRGMGMSDPLGQSDQRSLEARASGFGPNLNGMQGWRSSFEAAPVRHSPAPWNWAMCCWLMSSRPPIL